MLHSVCDTICPALHWMLHDYTYALPLTALVLFINTNTIVMLRPRYDIIPMELRRLAKVLDCICPAYNSMHITNLLLPLDLFWLSISAIGIAGLQSDWSYLRRLQGSEHLGRDSDTYLQKRRVLVMV